MATEGTEIAGPELGHDSRFGHAMLSNFGAPVIQFKKYILNRLV